MTIERRLQIGIALMTLLGTTLLGLGQHSHVLPILAAAVAISSLILTDIKGWLHFNTTVANLAALAAIGVAIWQWKRVSDESALLALANLLFYLQCVLLYRRKIERSYWLLALSSLLQVVVASALSLDMLFGGLLLVYLTVGIWTMCLFYLHREHGPFAESKHDEPPQKTERRWPLADARPVFVAAPVGELKQALTTDLHRRMLGLLGATLFLAVGLFLVLPRGPRSAWRPPLPGAQHLVGYTPQVTLGELGSIVENPALVMRLKFVRADTGAAYSLNEPPLLRGNVLDEYEKGSWRRSRGGHWGAASAAPVAASDSELVRQEISIEPLATNVLFCVHPATIVSDRRKVYYHSPAEQLVRQPSAAGQQLTYHVVTPALASNRQATITPPQRRLNDSDREQLLELPAAADGRDPLQGLKDLARQIVAPIAEGDALARAQAIERHFRESARFGYTLEPPERNPALDPIEDFVTQHPTGHCEYFASALALMLRSVGIPARLAIGFRGGEFNPVTKRYEVQQLHAHAWVEAWLAPEQVSETELPPRVWGESAGEWGAWVRLDPTPSAGAVNPLTESLAWYAWYTVRDFARAVWSEFVLDMDAERQHAAIYQPAADAISNTFANASDVEFWRDSWRGVWSLFNPSTWRRSQGWRLSASDVAGWTVSALAALAALYALARLVPRWWRWLRPVRARRRLHRAELDFYRRFETILQRRRWRRPTTQTPREFAMSVGGQLAEMPRTRPAAALPRQIVEAFYRVRYGGRPLDKREVETLEQALAKLEAALRGEFKSTKS